MNDPRIAARLPFAFDATRLLADLDRADAFEWIAHFNRGDYEGEWSGVALRSSSGRANDIYAHPDPKSVYRSTELLDSCEYFRNILDSLGFDIRGARLLLLAPASRIKPHRDRGLAYEFGEFRLHIPIVTSEAVSFWIEEQAIPMRAGECWYLNFDRLHRVENLSATRRVHLVIDCVRSEASDRVFLALGVPISCVIDESADAQMRKRVREELERLNTSTARALIAEMDQREK